MIFFIVKLLKLYRMDNFFEEILRQGKIVFYSSQLFFVSNVKTMFFMVAARYALIFLRSVNFGVIVAIFAVEATTIIHKDGLRF